MGLPYHCKRCGKEMWSKDGAVEDWNDNIYCRACATVKYGYEGLGTFYQVRHARGLLESSDFHEQVEAVDMLGSYGDAQDIDRLIRAQNIKGDECNRDIMFWRAGEALEKIAKRLGSSGTPHDVPSLIRLTREDLCVEAAIESLVTLLTKYASEIETVDLKTIARFDDQLSQLRSRPVQEMDYEGNERVWEPVDCVDLKALAKQEIDRRHAAMVNTSDVYRSIHGHIEKMKGTNQADIAELFDKLLGAIKDSQISEEDKLEQMQNVELLVTQYEITPEKRNRGLILASTSFLSMAANLTDLWVQFGSTITKAFKRL